MTATSDTLPTATRVSDPGIRALHRPENRWQAWFDVEAALTHAELGIIPAEAAKAIAANAKLELVDRKRIEDGIAGPSNHGVIVRMRADPEPQQASIDLNGQCPIPDADPN